MANYFEDMILEPKENGTELEKFYYEGMQDIDKLYENNGGSLVLQRDVKKVWDKDNISHKRIPAFAIPVETSLYLKSMGAVGIRYSKFPPQKDGKRVVYPLTRMEIEEILYLDKKNKDLAWFLIKATKFVLIDPKSKEEAAEKKHAFLKIYNPTLETKEKASDIKRILKVDMLLLDEESALYNLKSIQLIGDVLGVKTNKDVEVSAMAIREAILLGEKSKNPGVNIKRFLELSKSIINENKPEEVDNSGGDDTGDSYTKEDLDKLLQGDLNAISKKLGTAKVPQCKRVAQTEAILKACEVEINI